MSEAEVERRFVLTPWRVGLWGSVGSVVLGSLYGLVPAFEHLALPFGARVQSLYFVAGISAVSGLWAAAGLARRKRDGHGFWCWVSLFLVAVAFGFTALGAWGHASR